MVKEARCVERTGMQVTQEVMCAWDTAAPADGKLTSDKLQAVFHKELGIEIRPAVLQLQMMMEPVTWANISWRKILL